MVTFKILTHADERKIEAELKGLEKIGKEYNFNIIIKYQDALHTIKDII